MRLTKRRGGARVAMNMTPMIDIVFLLIIFFMTVSQISEINKEKIDLPQQKGVEEQDPSLLIVNVTQDGKLIVHGRETTVLRIVGLVSDEVLEKGSPNLVQVVIRADKEGQSKPVNEVVTALTQMQISRIRIAVQSPQ